MQRVLSFEQSPPLSVPLRFFLSAPLFALLAALLLLWHGPDAFASRWLPATLALTHLLTLGFLSMTMVGALIQILQVVVGIDLPWPRGSAAFVHAMLALGTLLLATGFLSSGPTAFRLALICLLAGFLWLLAACAIGLWRVAQPTPTVTAIRLALAGLAVTVVLGAAAASVFAWPLQLPVIEITNAHAAWGLLAWVGLLTIGVAYQVVPMFQVTPTYPPRLGRWLSWTIVLALLAFSVSLGAFTGLRGWLQPASALVLGLAFLAFGVTTLRLLQKRKRPPDTTTRFWRTSMASLLAAALLGLAGQWPDLAQAQWLPLMAGVLFIVGFACSVVNGMLYKIVPFLAWYHLQNRLAGQGRKAPNVRQIITEEMAGRQFYAHLAALALMTAAPLWPHLLARPAALAFGVSAGWLAYNLAQAARIYRQMSLSPDNCASARHPES